MRHTKPTQVIPFAAALLLSALVVATLLAGGHVGLARLIENAFNAPAATKTGLLTDLNHDLSLLQGDMQGVAMAGGPLVLIGGAIALGSGHRRGVGICVTVLVGLALTFLAQPIVS
jgi:hypothetical protein